MPSILGFRSHLEKDTYVCGQNARSVPGAVLSKMLSSGPAYSHVMDDLTRGRIMISFPFPQCVISCLIGTFGGTTVAMLSLGATPGWMGNLGSPVAFAMGFWMIFLCPGDIFYKLITRHRSVELVSHSDCGGSAK